MPSPVLNPDLAQAELSARQITGRCIGCGDPDCVGCRNPLAPMAKEWRRPLNDSDREHLRAEATRRRRRLGIRIVELAAHVGVTHQAISWWERDRLSVISDERVRQILEFLDEAEQSLGGVDLPSPAALRTRMLDVLDRYRIARKDLAARAGVSPGCIQSIAEAPQVRHYREVMAIVSVLNEISSQPPPPPKPSHGTPSTYASGCRCSVCRDAHRRRMKQWKNSAAEIASSDPSRVPHGLAGYSNWRCRCPVCKAAGSAANRRQRLRRKGRATESELPDPKEETSNG